MSQKEIGASIWLSKFLVSMTMVIYIGLQGMEGGCILILFVAQVEMNGEI